jgi:hypothetical protein
MLPFKPDFENFKDILQQANERTLIGLGELKGFAFLSGFIDGFGHGRKGWIG